MGAPLGRPKPEGAGRKKGTPNKTTLKAKVHEICDRMGFDPIEGLVNFAKGDWAALGYDSEIYHRESPDGSTKMGYVITPQMRITAMQELADFIHPRKKAIEHSGEINNPFMEKSYDELKEMVEKKLKR